MVRAVARDPRGPMAQEDRLKTISMVAAAWRCRYLDARLQLRAKEFQLNRLSLRLSRALTKLDAAAVRDVLDDSSDVAARRRACRRTRRAMAAARSVDLG